MIEYYLDLGGLSYVESGSLGRLLISKLQVNSFSFDSHMREGLHVI